ncbi:MAG: extracellular solute-binding protein [Patescibacteria group bacterium]
MKPFQVLLLAGFGFLALLGLFLFATFSGFGSNATKLGAVTIWGTLPESGVDAALNTLKADNQQYNQVSYVQKPEASFDVDLAEALASGTGPDLILISQEELATEQNKLTVIPFSVMSERSYLDTYLPISEIFLASSGTYGIPFAVDPLVLYYNRSLLTSAGVATPPASWEAVTGLSERLTQSQAGSVIRSVIPLGSYENVENARAILSLLLLQAGNPIVAVDTTGPHAQLTAAGQSSSGSTPAESAINFYTQFSDPAKTVYTWNRALASARQSFLSGDLVLYPGFASELPQLKASNPNLDFDMAPIPQPQTAATSLTFGHVYAFAIPKASKNPAGALTIAQALAAPSYAVHAASEFGMAPALRSSLTPSTNDRYQPVFFPQALIARGWLSPSPSVTDQIFSTMIGSITSGRAAVHQAFDTADQAIEASY